MQVVGVVMWEQWTTTVIPSRDSVPANLVWGAASVTPVSRDMQTLDHRDAGKDTEKKKNL